MKKSLVYIFCAIIVLFEIVIIICYFTIFNDGLSSSVDDWNLFYQLMNGLAITILTIINIAVFYKISVSLDVRSKLFEAQSIISQMRVRQYEYLRSLIKNIQVQVIRNNINSSDVEELKKGLMEMDNSFLYKNDNFKDEIFFKPLIRTICDDFENHNSDIKKTYNDLSNFIKIFEFYIIQQMTRDKEIKKYINDNKGNIDSTFICLDDFEREINKILQEEALSQNSKK